MFSIYILTIILTFHFFVLTSGKTFNVSNTSEFMDALDVCHAGDKIFLQPGTYRGEFVLPELGHGKSHTLITSATQNSKSVVISGRGIDPPLIVNGTRWALTKFTISNKLGRDIGTGLVLKMNEAFIKDLIIRDVDVAVQSEGSKTVVWNCEVHVTKMGLYMFGNESILTGNRIYGGNPCIFVDDLSCCGVVKGNRCDKEGSLFINGQDYAMDEETRKENDVNRIKF